MVLRKASNFTLLLAPMSPHHVTSRMGAASQPQTKRKQTEVLTQRAGGGEWTLADWKPCCNYATLPYIIALQILLCFFYDFPCKHVTHPTQGVSLLCPFQHKKVLLKCSQFPRHLRFIYIYHLHLIVTVGPILYKNNRYFQRLKN